MQGQPNGAVGDRVNITLSDGARAQAYFALLDELMTFDQIRDTVEALDAVGWREYIDRHAGSAGIVDGCETT